MESYEVMQDLIKSCLLPELKQDLDSIPIEREHFKSYLECLEFQLPILYDWIQKQNSCLDNTGSDNENEFKREIQAYRIVLFCEISFPDSIYHVTNKDLIRNADRLLKIYSSNFTEQIQEIVFKYYEEKLHKDKWKRQLGAIHGFVRYLEFLFNPNHIENYMNHKFLMFCLAVALNIRSCYETHYKTLSTSIFLIMLQNGSHDDIVSMNMHSVIYDAVFKDVHIMDTDTIIVKQWNCLIKCLNFYSDIDSFTWNYLDDMMEVLLRNTSLAPNSEASICLLKFVSKLIVYFTINNQEFNEMLAKDITSENIDNLRSLSNTNTSYTNYRWAKTILQMFIIESHKLMQTTEICLQLLQEIHKIYIVAILPIRLCVIEPLLITFLDKFIAVLMETIKVHKFQHNIVQAITSLLETFQFHLQNADKSPNLNKLKESICDLLKIKPFEQFISV